MKELSFTPRMAEVVGDDARQWLASMNAIILSQGVALEAAKGIFFNRYALSIDDEDLAEVTSELANHYGFDVNEAKGNKKLELQRDVQSALEFEQFEVDPFMAITEYNAHNWIDELTPYSEYKPREPIRFSTFSNSCRAAVVCIKATELSQKADVERDRILAMSTQEWNEYSNGVRWSQSARAQDVHRELMHVVKQVSDTAKYIDGLFFVKQDKREDMVRNIFKPLQTVEALNQNSQLIDIKPIDLMMRNKSLHLGNVLIPKPNNP